MTLKLEIDNVTTRYQKFVVKKVSFALKSGDIMGLVGRSGSGKSTIFRTIIGEKRSGAGYIHLESDEKAINLREQIGYSPQENSLYPYLSLRENIITFGRLYGVSKKVILKRMSVLLRRLNLADAADKRIRHLSGGMQKRADLAVTLIHEPKVIVLDEPFNGLDISLQDFIWEILHELSAEGKIILISSHLLGDIQKHCNRYGLVENGFFYSHDEIMKNVMSSRVKNLEEYLITLFKRECLR